MKKLTFILALITSLQSFSQIIPDVSLDTIVPRLFSVYHGAIKKGIYDLPRDTTWKNLTTYKTTGISFKVPATWLNLGGAGSIVEVAFDGSDLYFPDTFRNRPLLVGVFLLNQKGNSLDEAKELSLKDYRLNEDRVFEPGYRDTSYNYNTQNGKKGFVLHTRFYRKSKQLNQSRYDFIVFSDKLKRAYSVMISIQYADPTYIFEEENSLNTFAARIFSYVILE